MSDAAATARVGETGHDGSPAGPLTPERIDAVLADFRGWLTELLDEGRGDGRRGQAPPLAVPPPVDLASVVAQVTALRHEVNLQTKAVRAATEQTAEALKLAAPKPAADSDDAVRPLVKALIDIADALATSQKHVAKSRAAADGLLEKLSQPAPPSPPQGFFARLFGTRTAPTKPAVRPEDFTAFRDVLAGLADGYAMSVRRVERVLPQFGLEPVECVGRAFDPELMEVVEAVDGDGRASGTVVEEVRRGYRWHGKPFRFAQVKVAR